MIVLSVGKELVNDVVSTIPVTLSVKQKEAILAKVEKYVAKGEIESQARKLADTSKLNLIFQIS